MPNDIANNMADTIHQLEKDNATLLKSLTDLQLAYNEQMIELKEAKRLLKFAVDDIHELLCDRKDVSRNKGQSCNVCSYIEWCNCCQDCTIIDDLKNWRYANAVDKLLGELEQ